MGTTTRTVTLGVGGGGLEQVGRVGEAAPLFAERHEGAGVLELEGQREAKVDEPVEAAGVALEVRVREVVDHPRDDEPIVDLGELSRRELEADGPHPLVERGHGLGTGPIERIEIGPRQRVTDEEMAGQADRLEGHPGPAGDRQEHDRKGDGHAESAPHDRVEVGVGRVVIVDDVAAEVEPVVDEHAEGVDRAGFDRVGPRVELAEPTVDVDTGARAGRREMQQRLVQADTARRRIELVESTRCIHARHGIQIGAEYGRDVHPYLHRREPVGFAHRGGARVHPENTLRAFAHAVELGFVYLETDVHLTRDGVLVAFHDSVLDRVTDATGRIEDLTWEEVAAARVGGSEPIPRFDELMTAFPEARVNIDPKANRSIEALAGAIRDLGVEDRVCVTAFSRRRTRRVKALVGPDLCTGGGALATLATMLGVGRRLLARDVDVLQVPPRLGPLTVVTRRFVETAHRWGMHVHVWTIDDDGEMERLLDLGVDGIMTDEPERLRRVFARRGITLG